MKRLPIEFRVAIILGVGLASLGSLLWLNGDSNLGDGYYLGDRVFALGAPLTSLLRVYVDHFGHLVRSDDIWAIPVLAFLLVMQFAIWAAVVYAVRKLLVPRGT